MAAKQSIKEKHALARLQEELNKIEDDEKDGYLDALRFAPHLVENGMPLRFLRFTNYNATAAARGLVTYWKRRVEVFKEKAFLPVTLCGKGAISLEAIENLKSCATVHLPKDSDGCSVLCMDFSRRFQGASADVRRECAWYGGELLSRNPRSQTNGFVVLMLFSEFNFNPFDQRVVANVVSSFPIKPKATHIFDCAPAWKMNGCLGKALFAGFNRMVGVFFKNADMHFHSSQQKGDFVETMKSHGISKAGLPRLLGGSWSYETFGTYPREMEQDAAIRLTGLPPSVVLTDDECASGDDSDLVSMSWQQDDRLQDLLSLKWMSFMERALKEEISNDQKAAYLEARRFASTDVWNEEVDLEWFLQAEDFHPIYTAQRLARYWQLRSETFDSMKYKCLHQTGEGALCRSDLHTLATTFLTLLPVDSNGHPVLSIDGSLLKAKRYMTDASVNRCLFYFFSLLAECEKGRRDGVVILCRMASPSYQRIDFTYLARLVFSLPLRLKTFHFIANECIVPPSIEAQINRFCDNVVVHEAALVDEIALDLEGNFGIKRSSQPKYLGGGWKLDRFLTWQELRTRVELKLPLGTKGINASDFPSIKEYTEIPIEDRVERIRRSNIIHCRRKRDRVRLKKELLEEEHDDLCLQNNRLLDENRRLKELVQRASSISEQLDADPSAKIEDVLAHSDETKTTVFTNESSGLSSASATSYDPGVIASISGLLSLGSQRSPH